MQSSSKLKNDFVLRWAKGKIQRTEPVSLENVETMKIENSETKIFFFRRIQVESKNFVDPVRQPVEQTFVECLEENKQNAVSLSTSERQEGYNVKSARLNRHDFTNCAITEFFHNTSFWKQPGQSIRFADPMNSAKRWTFQIYSQIVLNDFSF